MTDFNDSQLVLDADPAHMLEVLWAEVGDVTASDFALLSDSERERATGYRRTVDRDRFVLATALLRLAAAAAGAGDADTLVVDRHCPTCGRPHSRPLLPGTGLHASITHSGRLVGVALTRTGPVGLDVEEHTQRDLETVADAILGTDERLAEPTDFFRYWTRKEAVVKATGDGIGIGLNGVKVTSPTEPPRLLRYPSGVAPAVALYDLAPAHDHAAAAAVLTDQRPDVRERWPRNSYSAGYRRHSAKEAM